MTNRTHLRASADTSYYDPDDTYEFFKDVTYDEDDVESEFE